MEPLWHSIVQGLHGIGIHLDDRAALSIFWRTDGQPCWHDPSLFADEGRGTHYTSDDAKRFMDTLGTKLGVGTQHILPGYEDTWYYLWRERRLPVNVDPFDARLDDEMERARQSSA